MNEWTSIVLVIMFFAAMATMTIIRKALRDLKRKAEEQETKIETLDERNNDTTDPGPDADS